MPAFPLLRTTAPLKERAFDLLVIGGGIYGAWTAYDAAQRGLAVALIERDDWGAGTSSASSKLIHGGLRYLEHYEFGLVRDALAERRRLQRLAPHLVRPLNFVLPVWKGPRASMLQLSAGLFLYDLMAIPLESVERHRRYSARRLLERYPYVDPDRLLGGFRYGDCQTDDARLTLTVVAAAQQAGATVANRLCAERLLESPGAGARVHDAFGGERFDLRARVVVNAAGPWAPGLPGAPRPPVKLIKGTHLVLPAIPGCDEAFLLTARDGRVFFVIPWYGRTLVGTTEEAVADPAAAAVTDDDVRYLLAGVHNGLPGIVWKPEDVIARFAGVRTLQAEDEQRLSAVTREFELFEPRPDTVVPVGGKLTTARTDAAEIVDRVERLLGRRCSPCRTAEAPLPGAPPGDEPFARWREGILPLLHRHGLDAEVAANLTLRYGARVGRIGELLQENPGWRSRIHPDAPFILAEGILAAREEMAWSLADVVRRRVPVALVAGTGGRTLQRLAEALAPEWGRDSADVLLEYRGTD